MRRQVLLGVAAIALSMVACSNSGPSTASTNTSLAQSTASPAGNPDAQDAVLILTMYADITTAFQHSADDGVKAVVAAQYPGDAGEVDFVRCVHALAPGATTLPASAKLRFAPRMTTMTPDPTYTITSAHVKNLHPKGRIYSTEVVITQGSKATTRERHQVIVGGKAYQFSSC